MRSRPASSKASSRATARHLPRGEGSDRSPTRLARSAQWPPRPVSAAHLSNPQGVSRVPALDSSPAAKSSEKEFRCLDDASVFPSGDEEGLIVTSDLCADAGEQVAETLAQTLTDEFPDGVDDRVLSDEGVRSRQGEMAPLLLIDDLD